MPVSQPTIPCVAQAGINLYDAATSFRPCTLQNERRAGEDGIAVIARGAQWPNASIKAIPDCYGHRRPMNKIFGDKVSVVSTKSGWRCEMNLIEVVKHAMHWVEDGPFGSFSPQPCWSMR